MPVNETQYLVLDDLSCVSKDHVLKRARASNRFIPVERLVVLSCRYITRVHSGSCVQGHVHSLNIDILRLYSALSHPMCLDVNRL